MLGKTGREAKSNPCKVSREKFPVEVGVNNMTDYKL